jgi:hypothetical protein
LMIIFHIEIAILGVYPSFRHTHFNDTIRKI